MDFKYIGWEGVGWTHLASGQVQLASCCENGNEPLGSIKRGELLGQLKNRWI